MEQFGKNVTSWTRKQFVGKCLIFDDEKYFSFGHADAWNAGNGLQLTCRIDLLYIVFSENGISKPFKKINLKRINSQKKIDDFKHDLGWPFRLRQLISMF